MTYIVSSDLDMLQIVDENTKMYRLLKGFSNIEEMDIQAIEEKIWYFEESVFRPEGIKGR